MIALSRLGGVLLCAGLSRRFGPGNKLMAAVAGKPLVAHASATFAATPLASHWAVIGSSEDSAPLAQLLREHGFTLVGNDDPRKGQERSMRLGLAAALAARVEGVVLALGDMPNVTIAHLEALAAAADADRAAISWSGAWQSPPVVIPTRIARAILDHPGRPIREVLASGVRVPAGGMMLADLDVPADFARARSR